MSVRAYCGQNDDVRDVRPRLQRGCSEVRAFGASDTHERGCSEVRAFGASELWEISAPWTQA
jgi:hypothetical protein